MVSQQIGLGTAQRAEIVDYGGQNICYWNADRYAAEYGGLVEHGWLIICWPQTFFMLVHHAVVREDSGRLVDPTLPMSAHAGHSSIIIDNRVIPPRDYPALIDNKFLVYRQSVGAQAYIAAQNVELQARRELMGLMKAQGVPFMAGQVPEGFEITGQVEQLAQSINIALQQTEIAVGMLREELAGLSGN